MAKSVLLKKKQVSTKWTMIIAFLSIWIICLCLGWFYLLPNLSNGQIIQNEIKNVTFQLVNEIKEEVNVVYDQGINKLNNVPHKVQIIKKKEKKVEELTKEKEEKEKEIIFQITDNIQLIQKEAPNIVVEPIQKTTQSTSVPKILPEIPVALPKTGDMWKQPVAQQREFLQNLHRNDPEPGTKAANEFIEYAKKSFHETIPENDPVNKIWPYPSLTFDENIGTGQPGDKRIKYHIAGKDVNLPYGYPEESIFILTVSYRDPEVASTIARAYARYCCLFDSYLIMICIYRAAHPERIFIGIHAQNEGGDLEPERDPIGGLKYTGLTCPSHPVCSYLNNIRVSRAHYDKSEGPTVARAIAERHYRNETYVLGIDSHCHFLRGWDNVGIDMFKRLNNDMALITSYPASYSESLQGGYGAEDYDVNPTPAIQHTICRTKRVNLHTSISFKHDMNTMKRPSDTNPIRVAFFAAGFSFSRGHRIINVPYDYYTPYIFDGEETSMGIRAWTWGYDLYQPDRDIISHFYIVSKSKFRPVFWDSPYWNIQWPTQFGSLIRLHKQLHIFDQLVKTNNNINYNVYRLDSNLLLNQIGIGEKYGVGPYRSVDDYWKWAEIDIKNNWGVNCDNPFNSEEKGRMFCLSENLCDKYYTNQKGGMPYIPLNKQ